MKDSKWVLMLRQHPGMMSLVFRVACYSTGMVCVMWLSQQWLGDTYLANASLFTIFSVVFELLNSKTYQRGIRLFCYIMCVVALGLTSCFLVHQAAAVQACAGHLTR